MLWMVALCRLEHPCLDRSGEDTPAAVDLCGSIGDDTLSWAPL